MARINNHTPTMRDHILRPLDAMGYRVYIRKNRSFLNRLYFVPVLFYDIAMIPIQAVKTVSAAAKWTVKILSGKKACKEATFKDVLTTAAKTAGFACLVLLKPVELIGTIFTSKTILAMHAPVHCTDIIVQARDCEAQQKKDIANLRDQKKAIGAGPKESTPQDIIGKYDLLLGKTERVLSNYEVFYAWLSPTETTLKESVALDKGNSAIKQFYGDLNYMRETEVQYDRYQKKVVRIDEKWKEGKGLVEEEVKVEPQPAVDDEKRLKDKISFCDDAIEFAQDKKRSEALKANSHHPEVMIKDFEDIRSSLKHWLSGLIERAQLRAEYEATEKRNPPLNEIPALIARFTNAIPFTEDHHKQIGDKKVGYETLQYRELVTRLQLILNTPKLECIKERDRIELLLVKRDPLTQYELEEAAKSMKRAIQLFTQGQRSTIYPEMQNYRGFQETLEKVEKRLASGQCIKTAASQDPQNPTKTTDGEPSKKAGWFGIGFWRL